jgi:hypothetical protein
VIKELKGFSKLILNWSPTELIKITDGTIKKLELEIKELESDNN